MIYDFSNKTPLKNDFFHQLLRKWESRERKKIREHDKEKQREKERRVEENKESKRLREFLEDYNDERDDVKYYKSVFSFYLISFKN